jgi:hypothetical protein
MTQSVSINLAVDVNQAVQTGGQSSNNKMDLDFIKTLANGTGADNATKAYYGSRSITASGTDVLNLTATLLDAFGAAITFTKIRGVFIKPAAANAGTISMGAGTNPVVTILNSATDKINIAAGGFFMAVNPTATGYGVTAATADKITITNNVASTVNYEILIVGE